MFSSSSGLASWLGKLPSSSQYNSITSQPILRKNSGANFPAVPFPASTTTLSWRWDFTLLARSSRYWGMIS